MQLRPNAAAADFISWPPGLLCCRMLAWLMDGACVQEKPEKKARAKKDKDAPKKGLSAFMFFSNAKRDEVHACAAAMLALLPLFLPSPFMSPL